MNDKCAGGTGRIIDKINAKLKIPPDALCNQAYKGIRVHPVAGKCGVFAETDINGLQKQGLPVEELMASLFDALVLQNLTVHARSHAKATCAPARRPKRFYSRYARGMAAPHPIAVAKSGVELAPGATPEELIKARRTSLIRCARRSGIRQGRDR